MPTFKQVSVAMLEPPSRPMRQESIMEGMGGLVADIASQGLLQPLIVRDLGDGRHQVIAGHRRSIAVTILKWDKVDAKVYGQDEGSDDQIMAAENIHRTQVNPKEEALLYARLLPDEPLGTQGLAMRYNVPQSRIETLLRLTEGDERVLDLVSSGAISVAQATEINKFETEAYRLLALDQATKHGLKAEGLRRWRLDVKHQGGEQVVQDAIANLKAIAPQDVKEPMQICQIGDHPSPLRLSKMYVICSEHWDLFMQGLESLHREAANGGGGSVNLEQHIRGSEGSGS